MAEVGSSSLRESPHIMSIVQLMGAIAEDVGASLPDDLLLTSYGDFFTWLFRVKGLGPTAIATSMIEILGHDNDSKEMVRVFLAKMKGGNALIGKGERADARYEALAQVLGVDFLVLRELITRFNTLSEESAKLAQITAVEKLMIHARTRFMGVIRVLVINPRELSDLESQIGADLAGIEFSSSPEENRKLLLEFSIGLRNQLRRDYSHDGVNLLPVFELQFDSVMIETLNQIQELFN